MEWLAENWFLVAGVLLILLLILVSSSRGKARSSSKKKATQREMAAMVAALVGAFERIVDDTIGSQYSYQDRQKIAVGMVAVIAARKLSLEQVISDPKLFMLVMAESVATLTKAGKISRY